MIMSYSTMLLLLMATMVGLASSTCSVSSSDEKAEAKDAANYQPACIAALEAQVRIEFEASLQYILMAAHFDEDTVNLPKIAELFWSHADEERSHAIQFIQYLRMRGADNNDFFGGVPIQPKERTYDWAGVDEALKMALKMEKDVSGKMKEMIDICSTAGQDDPHAADWLTGTWLEEQMQGQRHLAGLINTFNNFKRGHDELAEWMFDQEL
eukprot:TRINITY_DN3842_c0_g1_i1.p1 TRINITY_DN3842_c0_g1~~TRINITY_DN3842_c0_g1_i1.p1  ORF type:complete len:211 (+),score=89.05 TRINITY_DN3842_c0_g1_i1:148-780(+)